MNKNLKKTIKIAKKLQRKELLYINDSIGLEAEPNYQIVASIVESFNLGMNKKNYHLINNKEDLIHELAISSFKEDELISEIDIELMEYIIKEYIDIKDPVLIGDSYVFTTRMDKLQNLYKIALKQIEEGKFKNYIF